MKRIGIQANIDKASALTVAADAFKLLHELGVTPVLESTTAQAMGKEAGEAGSEGRVDALLVIGGDGTILRSAVKAAQEDVPMLGVNLGKKGFLTEVEINELPQAIHQLLSGAYTIESRMMLRGELCSAASGSWLALNDFILFKEHFSHTLNVDITVNGQLVGQYACDGLLLSTPTGSTAYSLSAGGPIVAPYVKGILITLICPHSLSARPMLVGEDDVVSFVTSGANSIAQLSADGQPKVARLDKGDTVTVRKAKETAKFIHFADYNFFNLVLKKLF